MRHQIRQPNYGALGTRYKERKRLEVVNIWIWKFNPRLRQLNRKNWTICIATIEHLWHIQQNLQKHSVENTSSNIFFTTLASTYSLIFVRMWHNKSAHFISSKWSNWFSMSKYGFSKCLCKRISLTEI